jgi:prepilin-type N-terminal cleavage/methylation domain-containing protein
MKLKAFTLAEVLITLGIIGVVAAMTIPTLIANINSARFRTQFKKDLSTLSQAAKMGIAQYDMDYSSANYACTYSGMHATSAVESTPETDFTICALLNVTLTGKTFNYITTLKTKDGTRYSDSVTKTTLRSMTAYPYTYTLADGSIVGIHLMTASCSLEPGTELNSEWIASKPFCVGFVDVNGTTLPNKEVTCTNAEDTALEPNKPCIVKNDATHLTDIYPIVFHDSTVEPATNAAKYVLSTTK